MARLDAALPPEAVAGPRYNERLMAFIDRQVLQPPPLWRFLDEESMT